MFPVIFPVPNLPLVDGGFARFRPRNVGVVFHEPVAPVDRGFLQSLVEAFGSVDLIIHQFDAAAVGGGEGHQRGTVLQLEDIAFEDMVETCGFTKRPLPDLTRNRL